MVDSEGLTKRVVYCIYEYDPLIDSSNMSYYEYRQLAQACVLKTFVKVSCTIKILKSEEI